MSKSSDHLGPQFRAEDDPGMLAQTSVSVKVEQLNWLRQYSETNSLVVRAAIEVFQAVLDCSVSEAIVLYWDNGEESPGHDNLVGRPVGFPARSFETGSSLTDLEQSLRVRYPSLLRGQTIKFIRIPRPL